MAAHYFETIESNVTGKVVSGAIIRAYLMDGANVSETLATIYSDDGVTPIDQVSSPLTTDAFGYFEFWTNEDAVGLTVSYDGAIQRTIPDVQFVNDLIANARDMALAAAADAVASALSIGDAVSAAEASATEAEADAVRAEVAADSASASAGAALVNATLLYNHATLYAGRGTTDPVTGTTGSDLSIIVTHATSNQKAVSAFKLWAVGAGTLTFAKYTRSGAGPNYTWTKGANVGTPVTISASGLASLTAADFGSIVLAAGEYLGWYFSGRFATNAGTDTTGWAILAAGLPSSGTASVSTSRIEYSATFDDQVLAFHASQYVDIESGKTPKKWSQEVVTALLGRSANLAVTKTAGSYVDKTTGVVTANASYNLFSGPVRPSSTIRANRKTDSNSAGYAFRDISGAFISGGNYTTANTDLAVPANAASIDFSVAVSANYPEAGPSMNPEFALVIWDTAYDTPADYVSPGFVGDYAAGKRASKVVRAHKPPKWDYYDPDEVTQGNLRTSSGSLAANTGFDVVRVPCEYGTPLYVSHAATGITNPLFAPMWYDKDGNKLAYSGASVTANFDGTVNMVVTAQSATYGKITKGMVLTDTTGGLIPAGTYVVDGPEDGGAGTYTLSAAATGTATGSTVEARVYGQNVPIYPPKGACFVDFNYNAGNRGRLTIANTAFTSTTDARNFIGWADIRRKLPWRAKQIAVLGDSIAYSVATSDNRFALNIEKGLRAYAAQVSPVPGRRVRDVLDATGGTYPATRGSSLALTSTDFANIDLCIIMAMTNDWDEPRALGALGDTGASNTFYGDLYNIGTTLQGWNPAMRVAFCTEPRRFDKTAGATYGGDVANGNPTRISTGAKLSDYADAIIAACKAYGYVCIDFFYEGIGVNALNKGSLLSADNLHPKAAGYSRMETYACDRLNGVGS